MNKETTDVETLASMIKDIKFTMMTTVADDGAIYSRPMAALKMDIESFDGRLWFFSKKNSPKIHSIENDQHINLTYVEPHKQLYVSVSGRATISEDKEKMIELWNPILKAWFPEGLEDPEISLIAVGVESAEVWDSPSGKVVQLAGFLKAAFAKSPLDQKENRKHHELN